jgi:hypothetical protein
MPNAKHKEKVKETSDVLKDCREVLHDHQISYFMIFLRDETKKFTNLPSFHSEPLCQ